MKREVVLRRREAAGRGLLKVGLAWTAISALQIQEALEVRIATPAWQAAK